MATLTGANAIIMLSITNLFPAPFQLQGFAADDVFDTDAIESAETVMGVDGILSAGYVNVPVQQTYRLQADSLSTRFFDTWWGAQKVASDAFPAFGLVTLLSVNKKWTLTKGWLTSYTPIPATKKLLQPQQFRITWESIFPTIV